MNTEMGRIFSRAFRARLLTSGKELSRCEGFRIPLADVKETESNVLAVFEMPGVDKKDIDVNVTENAIEVKVEKKAEKEVKGKESYAYEAKSHQFYRALPLPVKVNVDQTQATYKNGILRVEMPKLKRMVAKKKKVEIK